jgi:hypothetical protein
MRFLYTAHAEQRIVERGLSKKLIEGSILNYDQLVLSGFGRKIAEKSFKHKMLRVVFEKDDNVYIVVTAYFVRKVI